MRVEELRPFQRRFLKAVEDPAYDTVGLSGPRGLGKTYIAARVLARAMTPGDPLHQPGREYILGAASLEQARLTYGFIRAALEPTKEYRWIDSATRLGATHIKTNTKLRAISSNAKTSFGLVNVPIVVIDEPGALELVGGAMLSDSLFTAQGKPGSSLKIILIGTLAPMATRQGHWWYDLIQAGTTGSVHVQTFQGNAATWDKWGTIRKCNPLTAISSSFRDKLLEERDAARKDSRLKARFLSYRLNVPSADESEMLLSADDFERMTARPVPDRDGRPLVAVDLGAGRAWSAAVACWENGRLECLALAPGVPDIEAQERRYRVPPGTYQRLVDSGVLLVADGLRVQPASQLWEAILDTWSTPVRIVCDRFRASELADAVQGATNIEPRITRWSEASFDVRSLRKLAKDGPLSVAADSRLVLAESLRTALVKNDDAGNSRMVKRGSNNEARDDVAAVVGAKDRDTGQITARPIAFTDKADLQGFVLESTEVGSVVYTDEAAAYEGMPHRSHSAIKHSAGEYVKRQASTNGIESF